MSCLSKSDLKHKAATYKFGSGLTWNEAEAVVEHYMKGIENMSPEGQISMLRSHLARAVRDYKMERSIISAVLADRS